MKMRRWLAGLLTVILLVALLPASALAIQTELPNGPITRAQAALAVAETYGWTETPFVDIDGCSDLQKEAITALYAAGIVLVTALVMTLLADRMGRRPVETAPVSG